jgi:hypothetical protein
VPVKSKFVKINTVITAEQLAALRKLSVKTEVPVARLIRRGVDVVLKSSRKK